MIDAKQTLMIVDDDADIREVLQLILEGDGYTVLAAKNGADALELLRQTPILPGLILLDLQMPVMCGQSFLRHLRNEAASHLREIPVVVLSAANFDISGLRVNERLMKPVDVNCLLSAIEKHCPRAMGCAETATA